MSDVIDRMGWFVNQQTFPSGRRATPFHVICTVPAAFARRWVDLRSSLSPRVREIYAETGCARYRWHGVHPVILYGPRLVRGVADLVRGKSSFLDEAIPPCFPLRTERGFLKSSRTRHWCPKLHSRAPRPDRRAFFKVTLDGSRLLARRTSSTTG